MIFFERRDALVSDTLSVNFILVMVRLHYWLMHSASIHPSAGAASLADALRMNSFLAKMSVRNNRIGDAGAVSLAAAFGVNSSLTDFAVSSNGIGAALDCSCSARQCIHHES